nr:MAG TPA: hypothetical protein [Caudoviricetes sp.]
MCIRDRTSRGTYPATAFCVETKVGNINFYIIKKCTI